MKLTDEQIAIVDAAKSGHHVNVNAGAGTGKTSTVLEVAKATRDRKGIYTTFTRSMVEEAGRKFELFAWHVQAKTMHQLAFRSVGWRYQDRINDRSRFDPLRAYAVLKVASPKTTEYLRQVFGDSPRELTMCIRFTLQNFCRDCTPTVEPKHLPIRVQHLLNGLKQEEFEHVQALLVAFAQQVWEHEVSEQKGRWKFSHDEYLKIFQLDKPNLGTDVVYFDEVQDADPVMADIILQQVQYGTQLFYVGDRYQSLFDWRGSINAADQLLKLDNSAKLQLTQSWRFGNAIAYEANKWLEALDAKHRMRGNPKIKSNVTQGGFTQAKAILCRTNGGVFTEAMNAVAEGKTFTVPGGKRSRKMTELRELAKGAEDLILYGGTQCPALYGYQSWDEVVAEQPEELVTFINLVNKVGAGKILQVCNQATTDEKHADVIISTVHTAKGLEWDTVRASSDFWSPKDDDDINPAEGMIGYVGCTRAKFILDRGIHQEPGKRGGLCYVDDLVYG